MESSKERYIMLAADTHKGITKLVNDKIEEGYIPVNDKFQVVESTLDPGITHYFQAMVLDDVYNTILPEGKEPFIETTSAFDTLNKIVRYRGLLRAYNIPHEYIFIGICPHCNYKIKGVLFYGKDEYEEFISELYGIKVHIVDGDKCIHNWRY